MESCRVRGEAAFGFGVARRSAERRRGAHDRNLLKISVISLTPNFSWVLMAAKARGTVLTVSRFIFP
jgi:hypothetical protein